jgi:tetratricopeptide (TPR) repeat protein
MNYVASIAAQIEALTDASQLTDEHRAFLAQSDDLALLQHAIALFNRCNLPEPDDIQERSLRLLLRNHPHNLEYSRALIALLHRTGRPIVPEQPPSGLIAGPYDISGFEELLRLSVKYARAGETWHVYAAMWQACVRYPQTVRGWAEFARCLAERREWKNCRIAAQQVLKAGRPDEATAMAMLVALSTLAMNGEIASFEWKTWFDLLPDRLRAHPLALKVLVGNNNMPDAAASKATQLWPNEAESWMLASLAACEEERISEAYENIRRAFVLDPEATLRAVVVEFGERFVRVVDKLEKYDEIADWISERADEYPALNVVVSSPAPEAKLAAQNLRQAAMDRGLPSVLLVTQGASASVSVGRIFSSGFNLPTVLYSLVNLRVVLPWLRDYLKGGACYVTHLRPSQRNIELLSAGGAQSVIVHVRDPRQWLVSAAERGRLYANLSIPSYRQETRGGLAQTIEFMMGSLLPEIIEWIKLWIVARQRLTVHFTTFEDFVRDRDGFIDRILSLYAGDTRFFDRANASREQPGVDYHRRLGSTDEWRTVLTREQIDRINGLIPNEFWNMFEWQP